MSLDNAVVSLGQDVAPPSGNAPEDVSIGLPPSTAVVRFNVTPVDGLFPPAGAPKFHYALQVCYRGMVRARLVQVDLYTGAETDLLHFDSASFAPADRLVMNTGTTTDDSAVMDFVNFAYYVEATLTASAIVVGKPAQIAVIKVIATTDI